uniref:GPR180/TMEM145 transmembrane domain-containing protein n=2 Tax=Timema TaxID=61471 RepID=A0A7R9IIK2_9NEOP|nr:unnamed protein product [Timema bartmani]CAD7459062.1 unnamed protein product [Timema tahoe]
MCRLRCDSSSRYALLFFCAIFTLQVASGMHIVGSWNTKDFFKFLVKFGVQKTNPHNQKESHGYIFGNITSRSNVTRPAAFAVLDRGYFLEYYGNRSVANKEKACTRMFDKVSTKAYDEKCFDQGEDFLRKVPCPKGQLCVDEDVAWNVIKHHQFTFIIEDLKQPRFWYISMVACYRDSSCQWHHLDEEMEIDYDIWLVNGSPNVSGYNPFLYQFSVDRQVNAFVTVFIVDEGEPNPEPGTRVLPRLFVLLQCSNLVFKLQLCVLKCPGSVYLVIVCSRMYVLPSLCKQDTAELYLVFFLCYVVLVPLQLYAATRQKHPVTRLFTASLLLEFLALCFILIHVLKFAFDGVGVGGMAVAGDILDILSRTTFMLLLLLLAKGWAVTRMELTYKPLVFSIWFLYGVVHILLYVWNMVKTHPQIIQIFAPQTEVDIVDDIDEYQTWPGWLIIVFRTLIMVWFLYELRNTMLYEHNTQKLNFFLHFGASALVWFIYLPIIALIALQVSALWRFKLLLGITYSADCLAYCVMTHLLWPARSEQYFLLAEEADLGDELDEFNEAPHVINNYTRLSEPPDLSKIIA